MKKVTPIQCTKLADAFREAARDLEKNPELAQVFAALAGLVPLTMTPVSLIMRAVHLQAIGFLLQEIPDELDEEQQQEFRTSYNEDFSFWQSLDGVLSGSRYSQLTDNPYPTT